MVTTTDEKIKIGIGILVLLLVGFGLYWLYSHNKAAPVVVPAVTQGPYLPITPQIINTHTETIREISVAPAPPGNIMQFTEREGKQFVVIDGKEYQLATTPGAPAVKVGENGQIIMETQTTAKLDITDTVKAQVNDQLAVQSAALKKKYEKNWTVGVEVTNTDISMDITDKNVGITVGRTWGDGSLVKPSLRIGPRYQVKF